VSGSNSQSDADAAKAREAATLETLFASAHSLQQASEARSPLPPRFLLASAQTMARHLGMTDGEMKARLPSMAFWQMFLPSALAGDTSYFTEARFRLPCSFECVREGLIEMESLPQVVIAAFHMAAVPLIGALLAQAYAGLEGSRGHVLVSKRNIGWLQRESSRWTFDAVEIIGTDPQGLRRLMDGLKRGEITRLLILVDGPHPPGSRGTRALSDISPTLGFKTSLLTRILSMGIPIRPLTHVWEPDGLSLKWRPFLGPTDDGVSMVASLIEGLLRSHPEQWLNWAAASLRT